jgi:hypothetical protein
VCYGPAAPGVGFSFNDYDNDNTNSNVSSHLCEFNTRALSAGQKRKSLKRTKKRMRW